MILRITAPADPKHALLSAFGLSSDRHREQTTPWGTLHLLPQTEGSATTLTCILDISADTLQPVGADFSLARLPVFRYAHARSYRLETHVALALRTLLPLASSEELQLTFQSPQLANLPLLQEIFYPAGWQVDGEMVQRTGDLAQVFHEFTALLPFLDRDRFFWTSTTDWDKWWGEVAPYLKQLPHAQHLQERLEQDKNRLVYPEVQRLSECQDLNAVQAERMEAVDLPAKNAQIQGVVDILRAHEAKRVVDLGCGRGLLERELAKVDSLEEVMAIDVSMGNLQLAAREVGHSGLTGAQAQKVKLTAGNAAFKDHRFRGYDAVVGLDLMREMPDWVRQDFDEVLFGFLAPPLVIIGDGIGAKPIGAFPDEAAIKKWSRKIIREFPFQLETISISPTQFLFLFHRLPSA